MMDDERQALMAEHAGALSAAQARWHEQSKTSFGSLRAQVDELNAALGQLAAQLQHETCARAQMTEQLQQEQGARARVGEQLAMADREIALLKEGLFS
jgi:cob(I)alamin adenosyltransferase